MPSLCRYFNLTLWEPLAEEAQLIDSYWPVRPRDSHTAPTEQEPKSCHAKRLLVTPVHMLERVVAGLQSNTENVILVTPRWEHTIWFSRARQLCHEDDVLRPMDNKDKQSTQWAKVVFVFKRNLYNNGPHKHGQTTKHNQD